MCVRGLGLRIYVLVKVPPPAHARTIESNRHRQHYATMHMLMNYYFHTSMPAAGTRFCQKRNQWLKASWRPSFCWSHNFRMSFMNSDP